MENLIAKWKNTLNHEKQLIQSNTPTLVETSQYQGHPRIEIQKQKIIPNETPKKNFEEFQKNEENFEHSRSSSSSSEDWHKSKLKSLSNSGMQRQPIQLSRDYSSTKLNVKDLGETNNNKHQSPAKITKPPKSDRPYLTERVLTERTENLKGNSVEPPSKIDEITLKIIDLFKYDTSPSHQEKFKKIKGMLESFYCEQTDKVLDLELQLRKTQAETKKNSQAMTSRIDSTSMKLINEMENKLLDKEKEFCEIRLEKDSLLKKCKDLEAILNSESKNSRKKEFESFNEIFLESHQRLLHNNKILEDELAKKNEEIERQNNIWRQQVDEFFELVEHLKSKINQDIIEHKKPQFDDSDFLTESLRVDNHKGKY